MNIPDSIRSEFRELASQSPNREVGAYLHRGKLHSIENVSPDPNNLELSLEDTDCILSYLRKGEELILLHSHVKQNDDFSVQDIVMSKANCLPIYLYHLGTGIERYFDPRVIAPYEGRTWHWTYQNCYSLIQDFYKKEYGIQLKDFYLDHPTEFNDPRFNKFLLNIQTQGFIQLKEGDELKRGDLILFSMKGINPNHIGLMFDPEANKFLHQLVDRFSRLSSYCSSYRHLSHSIYRHQQLL